MDCCLFCGKDKLRMYRLPDSESRHLFCDGCGAAGPWSDTADEARTLYETARPATARPATIAEMQQELTRAKAEIQRLETANDGQQAELTTLKKAANAALTNIQGMLNGDDLPSMVIRDMLRAAIYPQPHEQGNVVQTCTWLWTAEDNGGFWSAQCKEDWPIQMLHEGARFCTFCGGRLVIEGQ